jgi:hypothetical protein
MNRPEKHARRGQFVKSAVQDPRPKAQSRVGKPMPLARRWPTPASVQTKCGTLNYGTATSLVDLCHCMARASQAFCAVLGHQRDHVKSAKQMACSTQRNFWVRPLGSWLPLDFGDVIVGADAPITNGRPPDHCRRYAAANGRAAEESTPPNSSKHPGFCRHCIRPSISALRRRFGTSDWARRLPGPRVVPGRRGWR